MTAAKPATGTAPGIGAWERDLRRAHPAATFYYDVRSADRTALVTVAYDGKTGDRLGEYDHLAAGNSLPVKKLKGRKRA